MDFIKLITSPAPPIIVGGELINFIDKSMWVERYSIPGEFSFEAKLSSGLTDFLPLGTLISHIDTYEIMIVETHEIKEKTAEESKIVISGRSFVSYLENRIVGMDLARVGSAVVPYTMVNALTGYQARTLIIDHFQTTVNAFDALSDIVVTNSVGSGTVAVRTIPFGTVWERVAELLKIDDLGIRTIRKNTYGVGAGLSGTTIDIYEGVDRSASVLFSWESGDIDSAQYLFSNKNEKNSALVVGQYIFRMVDVGGVGYTRRTVLIDGKDIDGHFGAIPTGTDLTDVQNAMTTLGQLVLANRSQVTITQTDLAKTAKYQYRKDFNIGDLVTVDGNFGQMAVFRVIEYAEIEDENGESGHPTLALPGA